MDVLSNAVLIQGATLEDIERLVSRVVEERLGHFCSPQSDGSHNMLKRKEAASRLGVSLPTIDAYSKVGLLHKKRIGGLVYFDEAEVLALKR